MDTIAFQDSGRGDGTFFVIVNNVVQPFLGYGQIRSIEEGGRTCQVFCVKREAGYNEYSYSVSIDGNNPPLDDWYSSPVSITRPKKDGVRCFVSGMGSLKFAWPTRVA